MLCIQAKSSRDAMAELQWLWTLQREANLCELPYTKRTMLCIFYCCWLLLMLLLAMDLLSAACQT